MRIPSVGAHILPQGLMGERLQYDSVADSCNILNVSIVQFQRNLSPSVCIIVKLRTSGSNLEKSSNKSHVSLFSLKASVTSPIDSLKSGFEAVYGGYGRRHTGKSWKIQKFQKGYRGGMMCWVRSWPRRQIHSAQPVISCQSKLTQPYLS